MTHRHNKSLCLAILSDNSDVQALFLAKTTQTTSVRHASTRADDTRDPTCVCDAATFYKIQTRSASDQHLGNVGCSHMVLLPLAPGTNSGSAAPATQATRIMLEDDLQEFEDAAVLIQKTGTPFHGQKKVAFFSLNRVWQGRISSSQLFRETALEAASLHNALPFFFSAPTQTAFT
jgi:hypothetical protein